MTDNLPNHTVAYHDTVVKFTDIDLAISEAYQAICAIGDPFAVRVQCDLPHVTIEQYLDALNVGAKWLEANPQDGCFMSRLMDADLWRSEYGFTTAQEIDDHLFWCTFSDVYKDRNGFRPRNFTRQEAEEWLRTCDDRPEVIPESEGWEPNTVTVMIGGEYVDLPNSEDGPQL